MVSCSTVAVAQLYSPHRSTCWAKTATELSSPNSEKTPRNICERMKRNAGFMAKTSAMMRIVQPHLSPYQQCIEWWLLNDISANA